MWFINEYLPLRWIYRGIETRENVLYFWWKVIGGWGGRKRRTSTRDSLNLHIYGSSIIISLGAKVRRQVLTWLRLANECEKKKDSTKIKVLASNDYKINCFLNLAHKANDKVLSLCFNTENNWFCKAKKSPISYEITLILQTTSYLSVRRIILA